MIEEARSLSTLGSVMLGVSLGLILTGASPPVAAKGPELNQRVVHEGLAVDFELERLDPSPDGPPRPGDDAVIRFRVQDTAGQAPISGLYPAAWLDLRPPGDATSCQRKVQVLLEGSIFSGAELDLNVYYVLTLNDDATISVVDPLFGFGGSRLLTMVSLASPGHDWALDEISGQLYVSQPEAGEVAVIDTRDWRVVEQIAVPGRPTRVALQHDGRFLWVASDAEADTDEGGARLTAISLADRRLSASLPIGAGPHDLELDATDRFVVVTQHSPGPNSAGTSPNSGGTVSIFDARRQRELARLPTGPEPSSITCSEHAGVCYITHRGDGTIVAVDLDEARIVATMTAEPGLGQIRFAPGGRLAFAVNPEHDTVHIIDSSRHRIVQTGDVFDGPDQVHFSSELAYVRHRGSEVVLMIPLDEAGKEGEPVPVVDFPGGQYPPGDTDQPTPAAGIVQAPGANAVLVANPRDRSIYYYKEGMAAPMGTFSTYGREPRAVLVVDRSLQERGTPGVYETTVKLRRPGVYDVVFFLDAPRLIHCFEMAVAGDAGEELRRVLGPVDVRPLFTERVVPVGRAVELDFKILDPENGQPLTGLQDLQIMVYLAPGIWHRRDVAEEVAEGVYRVRPVLPRTGVYYLHVEIPSLAMRLSNPQYLVLQAVPEAVPKDEQQVDQEETNERSEL